MQDSITHTPDTLEEILPSREPGIPIHLEHHFGAEDTANSIILHWHDAFQFCRVTEGSLGYLVDGERYVLKEGEGIFINIRHLHMSVRSPETPFRYSMFLFEPSLLGGMYNPVMSGKYFAPFFSGSIAAERLSPAVPEQKAVLDRLAEIENVFTAKPYAYEVKIGALFTEIMLYLLQENRDVIRKEEGIPKADSVRLDAILTFLHGHYGEDITLGEIAGKAGISTGECCRLFKRTLQQTPMHYLNRLRISKSTQLLQNTGMSISEVADAVGFFNPAYFTDRFKRIMNCTPGQFRKQQRTE